MLERCGKGVLSDTKQGEKMHMKANSTFLHPSPPAGKNSPNAKAIADLLSGRRKNSYGVEGMRITGRSDWKKIIQVSDEMQRHVYEDVKKEFYQHGGMSGSSAAEHDAYYDRIHSYIKTLDAKDRSPATWTLSRLHLGLAHQVNQKVRDRIPSWTAGQPIPREILDEIFADDALLQDTMDTISGSKALNVTV